MPYTTVLHKVICYCNVLLL